jgi:hypothetical protein
MKVLRTTVDTHEGATNCTGEISDYNIFHNKISQIKIFIQIKYVILNTGSWRVLLLSPTGTGLDVWLR